MTERLKFGKVLLDTGPLVAILDLHDHEHQRCVQMLQQINSPLLTSFAVLTEAAWLLRHNALAIHALLRGAAQGVYSVLPLHNADLESIDRLFATYSDLSPQLADLTLLHLANRESLDTVFTLDQRDFRTFRLSRRQSLRLLPADA